MGPKFFMRPRVAARPEPRPISRSAFRGTAPGPRMGYRAPVQRPVLRAPEARTEQVLRNPAEAREVRPGAGILSALGLSALVLLGCPKKYEPSATSDVPVNAADAGLTGVGAEVEIMDLTGEYPNSRIGAHPEPLRLNREAALSFTLPEEAWSLLSTVRFAGIAGPRYDRQSRSPFTVSDFTADPATGVVGVKIKPLRGAFSREEGASNTWHFVVGLGEGDQLSYYWYELAIEGPSSNGGRRDASPRRDDAGTPPADVTPPPRDVPTREARGRMGA